MLDIERIYSFCIAATMVIIIPGPGTFYIAGKAHLSAWHASYATGGIIMGDIILITLSGLGFSSLIATWPLLLFITKIVGASYIIYLGVELLRSSGVRTNEMQMGNTNMKTSFTRGILITLTNPKPILFFAAFFPMFIDVKTKSWMQSFYLLGGFFEMMNLFYFSVIILIISTLRRTDFFEKSIAGRFNKISGYGLIFLAGFILISTFISRI